MQELFEEKQKHDFGREERREGAGPRNNAARAPSTARIPSKDNPPEEVVRHAVVRGVELLPLARRKRRRS